MAPSKSNKSPSNKLSRGIARVKGESFYRNAKQAARVKMLTGGKPIRDRTGKIIQAAAFQKGEEFAKPGRVQPDRRWFGESRVAASRRRSEIVKLTDALLQAILGSSLKMLSNTSGTRCPKERKTLIRCCLEGISSL